MGRYGVMEAMNFKVGQVVILQPTCIYKGVFDVDVFKITFIHNRRTAPCLIHAISITGLFKGKSLWLSPNEITLCNNKIIRSNKNDNN